MQWVMFGYLGMADVAYAEKNIEKYKQNYDKYQQIHDSLYSQKRKNEIASIESQKVVDLKNKDPQITRLLLKNKEKKNGITSAPLFWWPLSDFCSGCNTDKARKTIRN